MSCLVLSCRVLSCLHLLHCVLLYCLVLDPPFPLIRTNKSVKRTPYKREALAFLYILVKGLVLSCLVVSCSHLLHCVLLSCLVILHLPHPTPPLYLQTKALSLILTSAKPSPFCLFLLKVLFCLVLTCLVLSRLVLSCALGLVMSYLVLSWICAVLPFLVLDLSYSCLALSLTSP